MNRQIPVGWDKPHIRLRTASLMPVADYEYRLCEPEWDAYYEQSPCSQKGHALLVEARAFAKKLNDRLSRHDQVYVTTDEAALSEDWCRALALSVWREVSGAQ